jgi:hypothetical protein
MPHFDIVHLREDRIAEAWLLVRMAAPSVALERWTRFAAAIRSRGGVLGAIAGGGALHGVAAYRLDEDLRHGATIRVDLLVTCELSASAPVRAALVEALEVIARSHGCAALTVLLPKPRGPEPATRSAPWAALGFEAGPLAFVKPFAPVPCAWPDRAARG